MTKEKEREAWTKVIDMFRDLSYLWDKKHKDYFNRDMRNEALKMLLQVLNEEIGKQISMVDFKKRLENMRTAYARELKKVIASKQTGSGSNDIYIPTLWYYPLFEFLDGTMNPCRPGTDTFDENCWSPEIKASTSSEQFINAEISDTDVPEVFTKSSQSKKLKIPEQSRQEKLLDSAQTLLKRQDDDWEIIGKSIGVQLKYLRTHQQVIAQKIISDALFYGKLGKLTDESIITLSPQHTALHPPCIPHHNYNNYYSSGSSITNSSPQPYQASPQDMGQPAPQLSPQSIPHTFEQSSFQYMNPTIPNSTYSPSSTTEHVKIEFPNCTLSDTTTTTIKKEQAQI